MSPTSFSNAALQTICDVAGIQYGSMRCGVVKFPPASLARIFGLPRSRRPASSRESAYANCLVIEFEETKCQRLGSTLKFPVCAKSLRERSRRDSLMTIPQQIGRQISSNSIVLVCFGLLLACLERTPTPSIYVTRPVCL